MTAPLVIAHRGASLIAPENSLAAIEAALALGADVIELDVHASADGVAVLIHDRALIRTTGRDGQVDSFEAATLGPWGVPRLADAVAMIEGRDATLCLEFKDGEYRDAAIAASWLAAQFDLFDLHRRAVANVPLAVAAELRRREPRIRLVVDCETRAGDAAEADALAAALAATGAHAVEYEESRVTAAAVRACHRLALPVWAWTANLPADWDRLIACGVDAILTDDAAGLLRHLGRPCAL